MTFPRALALALVLLVAACATRTTLSNVWKAQETAADPVERILVVGIAGTEAGRRAFEEEFAASLSKRGARAVPSYQRLPASREITEEAVREVVRARGFEAVLVTRLIEIDEDTEYVPPQTYVTPGYYGYGLYGYMGYGWDVVHSPGYTVTTTVVRLETHLYDARSARLVWAAHSETFDPESVDDVITSVTKKLSERLAEDGLLPEA